jgi:hypothetical protein
MRRGAKGIPFTLHHPHRLTDSEKEVFGSVEAFVACSLPRRLLEEGVSGSEDTSSSSSLLWLPSRILRAMRGSYFGDVIDPRPWEAGALILPYQCIKRAYQLEDVVDSDGAVGRYEVMVKLWKQFKPTAPIDSEEFQSFELVPIHSSPSSSYTPLLSDDNDGVGDGGDMSPIEAQPRVTVEPLKSIENF